MDTNTHKTKGWLILLGVIAIVLIVAVFKSKPSETEVAAVRETAIVQNAVNYTKESCYILEGNDKGFLNVKISDSQKALGYLSWLPAAKDKKSGVFEGSVSAPDSSGMQTINGTWSVAGQNMDTKENLVVKFGDKLATVGFSGVSSQPNFTKEDCSSDKMQ